MPKKIGKDVTGGSKAILSGKDAEDFERWQLEQLEKEQEKEEKPKSQVKIKSPMPMEPEASDDTVSEELGREAFEMLKWKLKQKQSE